MSYVPSQSGFERSHPMSPLFRRPTVQGEPMKTPTPIDTGERRANLAAYRNAVFSVEERVKDLLSRMTVEEKAAQMMCVWQQKAEKLLNADGDFDPEKAKVAFKEGYGLGQVGRPSDAGKGK